MDVFCALVYTQYGSNANKNRENLLMKRLIDIVSSNMGFFTLRQIMKWIRKLKKKDDGYGLYVPVQCWSTSESQPHVEFP